LKTGTYLLMLTGTLPEESSALKTKLSRYINAFELQTLIQVLEEKSEQ